ncbi:hypothetical protein DH2020_012901 [Rehmannia glutinosa]|uniref:Disease resistance N-terminal domain-containing protein n=1 Tax=Rehmannia glutinosa TaxID=99300 RepID=A0ABR0X0S8_REHGL
MADVAVEFLLEKVSQVLVWYVDLIAGAENDLYQLNNELGLLKSFLQDAATKPKKENLFREIERQIRDVVYDAEDTIDTCLTQAAKAKAKAKTKSKIKNFLSRHAEKADISLPLQVRSLRADKMAPVLEKIEKYATLQIGVGSTPTVEEPSAKLNKYSTDSVMPEEWLLQFRGR